MSPFYSWPWWKSFWINKWVQVCFHDTIDSFLIALPSIRFQLQDTVLLLGRVLQFKCFMIWFNWIISWSCSLLSTTTLQGQANKKGSKVLLLLFMCCSMRMLVKTDLHFVFICSTATKPFTWARMGFHCRLPPLRMCARGLFISAFLKHMGKDNTQMHISVAKITLPLMYRKL